MLLIPQSEDRMILSSIVWVLYQHVTNGQTDGQTDGFVVASTRLPLCAVARKNNIARGISDRVIFKLAVTVHRCLNGRAPPYLSDYCAPVASADRRHLRSTNCQLLVVPRYRLNTYSRRAFSVAGHTVWNPLLDFIRDPTISSDCFRRLLKTYLFARY